MCVNRFGTGFTSVIVHTSITLQITIAHHWFSRFFVIFTDFFAIFTNFHHFHEFSPFSRNFAIFTLIPDLFSLSPTSQFVLPTIKTDVECSSWEQQQFVYSPISNQIISAGGDSSLCLSFSESEISSKLCDTDDLSQVFTSPVSLTNSELSFITTSGVANQLTPVSSSSSYPVLKTECVLPEYRVVLLKWWE